MANEKYRDVQSDDFERLIIKKQEKAVFRLMMQCLGRGSKKLSMKIIEELFDGLINSMVQTDVEAGEAYSDCIYDQIYEMR